MTRVVPSGEQFELAFEEQRATVVEVGGGIRAYEWGGRPVLHPYARDAMCDGAHGAPLVPWPNRLADGRYSFEGELYQVPLTEPEKRNAIHGLLRWRSWRAVERAADRVVMGIRLHPQLGYPFLLDVRVEYRLDAGGLTVCTTAANAGDRALPYGCGHHPYLSPGPGDDPVGGPVDGPVGGLVDGCVLELDAATRVTTDERRQLPTGTEAVEGTPYDFRGGRKIGDLAVDHAFTDLARDADGRAWTRLTGTDGRTAEIWVDGTYPLVEIFTGDGLPGGRHRRGLGAEPMTCPPNALATGDRVLTLRPGESVTSTWGARLRP